MPSELITLLNTLKTDLEKKLEAQHHEFEHSIVAVKEALENEIKKRKEQPASGGEFFSPYILHRMTIYSTILMLFKINIICRRRRRQWK